MVRSYLQQPKLYIWVFSLVICLLILLKMTLHAQSPESSPADHGLVPMAVTQPQRVLLPIILQGEANAAQ